MSLREGNVLRVELGENIKLSRLAEQRLEASIQKAVLVELAKYDLRGDFEVKFSPEWLGIWLNGGPGGVVFEEPRFFDLG